MTYMHESYVSSSSFQLTCKYRTVLRMGANGIVNSARIGVNDNLSLECCYIMAACVSVVGYGVQNHSKRDILKCETNKI